MTRINNFCLMDEYIDEERDGSWLCYPTGYRPKEIYEQVRILQEIFPGIKTTIDESLVKTPLPEGAEGWFAIPRFELLNPSYNAAASKILVILEKRIKKFSSDWSYLGPAHLRQTEREKWFWRKIGKKQKKHDVLLIPAQFGLRHRGRSARRACAVMNSVINSREFGLGVFAVGIMLLTHPERLSISSDLHLGIDCPGDEMCHMGNPLFENFENVPYFSAYSDICFGDHRNNELCTHGSASAFMI